MKRNPKIKDLFTPEEGIFDFFPDTLWGDSLSKENLNAEFYFALYDLYATQQVKYYLNQPNGMERLSNYLYEKHYRQLEMIWTALNEEYNMFLTGRLMETREYTRDESLTGSDTMKKTMNGLRTSKSDIERMLKKAGSVSTNSNDTETYEDNAENIVDGNVTDTQSGHDRQTDTQTRNDKNKLSGADTENVNGTNTTKNTGTQDNTSEESTFAFNSTAAVPTKIIKDKREDKLNQEDTSDTTNTTEYGRVEEVDGTTVTENLTDYGKTHSVQESTSDSQKSDGKRTRNNEEVTDYNNYSESETENENNETIDEGSEDIEGSTDKRSNVVYSETLDREADSPLQTTQQLIREELEIRQTSFVDQMINILRQSTTLKVWR